MKTVRINLSERSYNIYVGHGIMKNLRFLVDFELPQGPFFIVTNKKINRLHGSSLRKALKPFCRKTLFFEVPDSEKSKSFPVYIKTIRRLARLAKKTKPLVFAFGGGVIGDLAGFVASAYRRGVPYIQVPTTLLAQVDSAIGGKVAIDIKEAKNIVGNFYQPKMVLCESDFLKTLPKKELRNGMAEVIKYGIISDGNLFGYIEKNMDKILKADPDALSHIVFRSCSIKAGVVEKDEADIKNIRAVLNFGHTVGHAMEAASRYSGQFAHGQAVAEGMIMASLISFRIGILKKRDLDRICCLIRRLFKKTDTGRLSTKEILKALAYDKKFIYGVNRFILPERIGNAKIVDKVPGEIIKTVVEENVKKC